ncbi:tRNA (guanine-N(7)-)-methyltransferase [Lachnospiraceae oral taxon 107 str. F0167]|nr:tRNA (guanine-N(7)-)-methyltransferase [Lachnospiraceae oral taxon 107 str. F0167]
MRLRHIKGCEDFISDAKECIREDKAIEQKGKIQDIFKEKRPLQIEIGMGKGQFIRNMAIKNPDINFIGIEKYESVLMKAIQRKRNLETEKEIDNLRFLCADARKLAEIFDVGEVDNIFLNFSDPWPKDRHANRRLTSPDFLNIYDTILKKDGVIEFKTDNRGLFEYSLEVIKDSKWKLNYCSFDFHSEKESEGNTMTEYEEKFAGQGNKICKMIISR